MAKLTDDLELGPGVVVTPGHEVPEPRPKAVASDRKIDHEGNVVHPGDAEFGSTYEKGGDTALAKAAPDRKVAAPETAA
jgi:hypothetical protein